MFRTYTVGRSKNTDITIQHDTISRVHLEITLTAQSRYYLIDRNSTHGTYVWEDDAWQRLQQGYMEPDQVIALGKQKVSMEEIISKMEELLTDDKVEDLVLYEPVSVKPRRNAGTGEVIK